jgi:MFS family permease
MRLAPPPETPDYVGNMRGEPPARPSGLSNAAAIYTVGLFGMGYTDFYIFLIPLYGLSLGMSASEIGLLVGGRSLLAVFLSIHIGVLMDRFGTRRVTLFFVWSAIALAPVFPLLPWFWPLFVLQLVNGGALSFAWSGAQTLIAQMADGEAEYIGRFSFFARIGTTAAPIIAGLAWDFGGAWQAYMLGALWGVVLTVALLRAPEAAAREPRTGSRVRLRDMLPRLSDYSSCFALMAIPAVATSMAIIFLRTATNGVQSSLYVVYLNGIGLTGTTIGLLFAAIEIFSGLGSLFAGRAMRLGDPQKTMLSGTIASIGLICVTPFLGGIYALLLVAQVARGWLQGVVQPMMFSVQAKAVGPYRQGAVVGLRQTMNRLAAIIIPPLMGMIADGWGATASFVILGVLLTLLCLPIIRLTRRSAQLPAIPSGQASD